jgi:hypothetical protein
MIAVWFDTTIDFFGILASCLSDNPDGSKGRHSPLPAEHSRTEGGTSE